jgi:hypothetical protein
MSVADGISGFHHLLPYALIMSPGHVVCEVMSSTVFVDVWYANLSYIHDERRAALQSIYVVPIFLASKVMILVYGLCMVVLVFVVLFR